MVGGSELAFRLLARRHGAQLCYTPMIHVDEFNQPGAGTTLLERHVDDCPVVAHFSGDDPQKLLDVAKKAESCKGVVAIDLNLGCPQRSAQNGHFGAFLCGAEDRQLLLRIVSTLSRSLSVPFFCKIRLLDELDDTLEFAQQLQDAGCALLAVHGRYRGSPLRRRDGPAHHDQIALIKQRLSIPVISNGNVRNAAELVEALQLTAADGVMSAEGALDDPAIFAKAIEHVEVERARLTEVVKEARALKADKREHGRKLTAEEKAKVKERKAAKRFLAQLPELRRPPPLSSAVPMPAPMPAAAASRAMATRWSRRAGHWLAGDPRRRRARPSSTSPNSTLRWQRRSRRRAALTRSSHMQSFICGGCAGPRSPSTIYSPISRRARRSRSVLA